MTSLPLPPLDLRRAVGPLDDAFYDNPTGLPIFPDVPADCYQSVVDFGCGCGRLARQLIQQHPAPRRYLGVDLHRRAIDWCAANLSTAAPQFRFEHLDVFNAGLNPGGQRGARPLPVEDRSATLVIAWSVFTHVVEADAVFYLRQVARALRGGGRLLSTWFLFEKREFPMLQDFQNALFVNDTDPTNAVLFDREWLLRTAAIAGLDIVRATPPRIRGYQWELLMAPAVAGRGHVALPEDTAPYGRLPPPVHLS